MNVEDICKLLQEVVKNNKVELLNSDKCGCFGCMKIYDAKEVVDFDEVSGECPYCHEHSVLPDSLVNVNDQVLDSLNRIYYKNNK